MRSVTFGALAAVVIAAFGCSGSSGGGGGSAGTSGSAGAGGSAGTGSGSETVSCTVAASGLCTQELVPTSSVAGENSQCTSLQMGTTGTGCSTTGLIGCCKEAAGESQETQCYYIAANESTDKSLCTTMKGTWSATP
jgi:hypothetical protein